ncbi:hypothetical protein AOLI_G00106020 [Acnodon oligacanthus]
MSPLSVDLPRAALTVEPKWSPVFTGESVTLKCEIESVQYSNWRYQWYKGSSSTAISQSQTNTFTITSAADQDQYWCRGERDNRPSSSQPSNPVTLTVKERPKAAVSTRHDQQVFRGETVTLRCDIQGGGVSNWQYSWFKDGSSRPVSNEQQYRISSVTESHRGKYTCRGTERGTSHSSHSSDAVTLTVSDLPRATLTVESESPVFIGESVTLKCETNTHDGWTYQWYKQDKQSGWTAVSQSVYHTVNRDTLTIRGDAVIHGDQYQCRGQRRNRPTSSQYSDSVTLTVKALPRATVTVEPKQSPVFTGESVTLKCEIESAADQGQDQYRCRGERDYRPTSSQPSNTVTVTVKALPRTTLTVEPKQSPVFTGESVTLKCEIETYSNWRYQWYKGSSSTAVSQSQTNTFTIRSAADQDQYWCRGERDYRPSSSQQSNILGFSVKAEKPKPELRTSHKGAAVMGNPVVLYCKLDQSAGWRFYWFRHSQSPENETKTETHSYTISSVSVSDGGQYWCRAGRGNPVYYTHYSDALWINVTGTIRPVSLTVSPSRAQHFITDSLTELRGTDISSLSTSHTGVYWCESESGESSNPVNITVTNGEVILESPVHPVTEGDPLTLRCLYRHTTSSNLTAEFYKDGSLLQTQTTGEMTIHTVSKSDEGLYHCKYPKIQESPKSWISDKEAPFPVLGLFSSLVAVFQYLLVTIVLVVKCYRARDLLKPTLTVESESPVFIGESVTLKCETNTHDGWTYQWYKQDKQSGWTAVSQSVYHTVNRDTLTIRGDAVIHGDQYQCRGERRNRPTSSQYSDSVTLTVKALPRATLYTVEPESPVFTGGSFTLKCEINTHDGWTFQWYKQDKQHRLTTVSQSEYHNVNGDTLTIRGDAVIHGDQHLCRGERRNRPKLSQYSNSVALPVKALPTATLTVEPKQSPVFSGESVTLKCEIETYSNWRYQWYKGSSRTAVYQSQTNTFTIRSAANQDQDQYWCRGERDNRPTSSQHSNTVTVTVKGEAKAVLSIKPDKHVFRGEAVILRCDIQWGRDSEWKYSWYKDTNTLYSSSTTQEFRFSPATESHSGKYTCSGEDIGNSGYSQTSDAVTLTVTGLARATLTVEPEAPVFSGESVTLKCEIETYSNWRYQWYKGSSRTAVYQSQTNTFTIGSAADQDQDQYWCRGERDNRPTSQLSNPFNLTVKDTSPEVSLSISPSRAQHFITDSLSLSCEGQSDSTGLRVRRYTHSEKGSDCSSGWGSVTGSTCSISSLSTSHTGVYWCESESGESSNPVNITVTNGDVILNSPVHPVTEGDPLTLHCLYRDPKTSNLTAEFYKDGSLLQTQTTGEMTIHTVSKSDDGLYHCKDPERGESPQSWISVKGLSRSGASFSVFCLLSSVMAASPYLLVSIVLALKCYRARAKPEETNRTEAATEAGESC